MDDFFAWRKNAYQDDSEPLAALPGIEVHKQPNVEMKFDAQDELSCEVQVEEIAAESGVSIMHCPPPVFPTRGVLVTLDPVDDEHVDVIFSGNLKPFEESLNELRVARKSMKVIATDAYPEVFYSVQNADITKKNTVDFILQKLLTTAFAGAPVVARVRAGSALTGKADAFFDEMKALENVYACTEI